METIINQLPNPKQSVVAQTTKSQTKYDSFMKLILETTDKPEQKLPDLGSKMAQHYSVAATVAVEDHRVAMDKLSEVKASYIAYPSAEDSEAGEPLSSKINMKHAEAELDHLLNSKEKISKVGVSVYEFGLNFLEAGHSNGPSSVSTQNAGHLKNVATSENFSQIPSFDSLKPEVKGERFMHTYRSEAGAQNKIFEQKHLAIGKLSYIATDRHIGVEKAGGFSTQDLHFSNQPISEVVKRQEVYFDERTFKNANAGANLVNTVYTYIRTSEKVAQLNLVLLPRERTLFDDRKTTIIKSAEDNQLVVRDYKSDSDSIKSRIDEIIQYSYTKISKIIINGQEQQ